VASRSKRASSRSPIKLGLGVGIFVLTLVTALIHLYLGLGIGNTLFVLNGLGYLGLIAALQLPIPQLARFRNVVRWVLVAYTALTIVLFFIMAPFYSVMGYVDKAIEVVLIALLIADAYTTGSSEPSGRV
jgi:predicted metal-binding membrane protein